jgi:hypothetical protein
VILSNKVETYSAKTSIGLEYIFYGVSKKTHSAAVQFCDFYNKLNALAFERYKLWRLRRSWMMGFASGLRAKLNAEFKGIEGSAEELHKALLLQRRLDDSMPRRHKEVSQKLEDWDDDWDEGLDDSEDEDGVPKGDEVPVDFDDNDYKDIDCNDIDASINRGLLRQKARQEHKKNVTALVRLSEQQQLKLVAQTVLKTHNLEVPKNSYKPVQPTRPDEMMAHQDGEKSGKACHIQAPCWNDGSDPDYRAGVEFGDGGLKTINVFGGL